MTFPCPIKEILDRKLCVKFTLFDKKDGEVMEDLAKILGANTELKERLTTHIVLNDDLISNIG